MPYDPNWPQPRTAADAVKMRAQLNALKTLIDNVPAGQQGPPGNDGAPGPQGPEGRHVVGVSDDGMGRAIVQMSDGTTYGPFIVGTGPQGQQGNEGIPGPQGVQGEQGIPGPQGEQGIPGEAGPAGNDGAQGPAGIQGDAGPQGPEGRHVVNVADNGNGQAIIQMNDGGSYGPFTVATGPVGPQGNNGNDGATGPQGPAGEVTNQQLTDAINNAIAGTSNNSNSVATLGMNVSDPPTQSEMQTIANKIDELINALRR